ncbi:MAG: LbtU family siderophore porin [Candidatus Thiodiazotropha sp. (ex Dulcina madagascariensis)]|nr:LbtU family siderophore porin [Candidatus Thiodiazotropha sp. (ex Dulcina madagascariensis)]
MNVSNGVVTASAGEAVDVEDEQGMSSEPSRIYRTREEQREAGLKREITPWLTLSSLLEGEVLFDEFDTRETHPDIKASEDSASLQLGLVADLFEWAEAEVIVEYETDVDKFVTEEAFVTLEHDPWELILGKQFTPFGVYYSHFVSGPLIEFGETQARKVATLSYGPSDRLDLSIAVYRGRARELGKDSQAWDWAVALESWPGENWSFGVSYQSDLADADERLLEEVDDRYAESVSGVSGYLLLVGDQFEFSLEVLAATDIFRELDRDRNRPSAWNAELVHFMPGSDFELAFRLEGSRELEEAPKYRYGLALTRYEGKHASLTLEYLHGQFEEGFHAIEIEDEIPIAHVNSIGAKVIIEF